MAFDSRFIGSRPYRKPTLRARDSAETEPLEVSALIESSINSEAEEHGENYRAGTRRGSLKSPASPAEKVDQS